jgi:hypothetical protein
MGAPARSGARSLRYLVREDLAAPRMLVRIDESNLTAERILPSDPKWFSSNNLLELLWDSQGEEITEAEGEALAAK